MSYVQKQIINKGINFEATKQLSKVWINKKIFHTETTHTAVAAVTKSNQEFSLYKY